MNLILFSLVLFGNLWIWKMFSVRPLIAFFTLITSISLFLFLTSKNKFFQMSFLVFFATLLFFQWKTTEIRSLTQLSNDQQRIQHMRLNEYPPVKFTIFRKTLWIPAAHWFEGRSESIAFFRILENFSEVIDPNLYFFANHPRQRIGTTEFEKFPYLLLPFFVYGLLAVFRKYDQKILLSIFITPLILISLIGGRNSLGPFSLFPTIAVVTFLGIKQTYKELSRKYGSLKHVLLAGFFLLLVVNFLQIFMYEKF